MAALQSVFVFSLVFCCICAFEFHDTIIDNQNPCRDICDKTYSAHTYENGPETDSCRRGCRFFAIMDMIHSHDDINASVADCSASCEEAYSNSTADDAACKLGCNSQHQQTAVADKKAKEEEPSIHLLYPLMYVHGFYSNMIDKVYHHMEVSWALYVQADNGQLVVIKSEPRTVDSVSADMEDIPDSLSWMDDKTSAYLETNIAGQDNSATPLLNLRASQMRAAHSQDGLQLNIEDDRDSAMRSDWLTCVARKTGIARIVLCFLILATAVVMIWFCLTAAATAPEHRLSINGDVEYLRSLDEKDAFKLLHPQVRVEARPLPVKIRVQQI